MDSLYDIYKEESITQYMEGLFENPDEEREYITNYRKYVYAFYEYGMWIIEEKATGKIIGRAGIDPRGEENELGYVIGVPWQKQGYAYEVCMGILHYAQTEMEGCEKIISKVQPENTPSIRLLEKLGFEKYGYEDGMLLFGQNLTNSK